MTVVGVMTNLQAEALSAQVHIPDFRGVTITRDAETSFEIRIAEAEADC